MTAIEHQERRKRAINSLAYYCNRSTGYIHVRTKHTASGAVCQVFLVPDEDYRHDMDDIFDATILVHLACGLSLNKGGVFVSGTGHSHAQAICEEINRVIYKDVTFSMRYKTINTNYK